MPPELRPPEWRNAKKPMCCLVKALYGHPESGAHWERHLEAAVTGSGGVPITGHPSSFWFEEQQLALTVYVDDLLLAGPTGKHEEIWTALKKRGIALEPAEDLSRFLGRSHEFEQAE